MAMGTAAYAAASPTIYADQVVLAGSEDVMVPVYIKNNPGLMGFHFVLKYDADKLTVTNVTSSDLTSGGLFNQNLNMKKGKFDVVWSGPESMDADGPLFFLYLRAADLGDGASIKISYVEDDTFDDSLKNVAVKCKSIRVSAGTAEEAAEAGQQVVEEDPEVSFVAKEISDEVTSQLAAEDVLSTVQEVMEEESLENVKDIMPDQARKVLEKVKKKMEEQGASTEYLDHLIKKAEKDKNLDSDSIVTNAVTSMYKASERMAKTEDEGFEVKPVKKEKNSSGILIVILILTAAAAAAIIWFLRKQKMRGTESDYQ